MGRRLSILRISLLGVLTSLIPSTALAEQNSPEAIIFGTLGMLFLGGIVIYFAMHADVAATDPENIGFADQNTLQTKLNSLLAADGIYNVAVIRQSGNVERVLEGLDAPHVVTKILQIMRKARIDTVSIVETDDLIQLYRTVHNGRGRQEGKRIGGFNIVQNGLAFKTTSLRERLDDETLMNFEFETGTIITLSPESEAQKAIVKAFFRAIEKSSDEVAPKAIIRNYDAETGEGNDDIHYNAIVEMLIYADLYLVGEGQMTDEVRAQLKASDRQWQRDLGNNLNLKTVMGIHAFGSTSPKEIKQAFEKYWQLCEVAVDADQEPSLTTTALMKTQRPKILSYDYKLF